MKTNKFSKNLPTILSVCGIFTFGIIFYVLYNLTSYLPFKMAEVIVFLSFFINLALIIFKCDIPISEVVIEESDVESDNSRIHKVSKFFKNVGRAIATFYNLIKEHLRTLIILALLISSLFYFLSISKNTASPILSAWHPVILIITFIVLIIIDKFCKYLDHTSDFSAAIVKNIRTIFFILKVLIVADVFVIVIKLLGFYDLCKYLIILTQVAFYYTLAMTFVSLLIRYLKKELSTNPGIVILLPFVAGDASDLSLIDFLEENTGITLRSLWSLKFIKKILPYMALFVVLILWISTGIVQIESYQEGVVYRFGKLLDEPLKPGIYLNLPYPIDKTEVYDTQMINKITIGYNSTENNDNVWTESQENEYRLLLGSGNELVSINFRIEYKISDLIKYVRNATNPNMILQGKSYELATDLIIGTDLHTLLAINREAFSQNFLNEISKSMENADVGIEIVSVIIESIHPPVEVANVYQKLISAEINAEKMILDAQAAASVRRAQAEALYYTAINLANADRFTRESAAKAEVAEFMASVEAYKAYPKTYVYYKYLTALSTAYGKANLVIVGEGIDGSRLYFGKFN